MGSRGEVGVGDREKGNTEPQQHLGAGLIPQGLVNRPHLSLSPVYHKQVAEAAAQKYSTAGTIGSYSIPTTIRLRRHCFLLSSLH